MSRPRQAFGAQPGRLPATLLRALSAELSDPARYKRAKDYARDGAIIEIDIRAGVVAGQVLGSRRDPYEVMIYVDAVDETDVDAARDANSFLSLMPERTELAITCTCPDADSGVMCKHALSLLMVFADEVSIEPDLLARWRSRGPESPSSATRLRASAVETRIAETKVPSGRRADIREARLDRRPAPEPVRVDVLATVLSSPAPLAADVNTFDIPELSASDLATPSARADGSSALIDKLLEDAVYHVRRRPNGRR